jgi:hypothetical protein
MKASYLLHPGEGYVAITLEGSVTVSELAAHIQRLWSDPDWNPAFNGLLDCSAASLEMSEIELQGLVKAMAKDPRCSLARWAAVVSTATTFAMFRKVDQVAEFNSTLRIFFDRRSAEEWLLKIRQPGDKP